LLHVAGREVYSETMYAHDAFGWSPLRSLREGAYQYFDAPRAELYDLEADPGEQRNVIEAHAMQARALRDAMRRLMGNTAPAKAAHDASPATESALQSLGYGATAQHQAVSSSGPDPKSRLPEYHRHERGLGELYEQREQQSVEIFRQLLAGDPQNTIARYYLGDAYLRSHQRAEAIREWNAALRQDKEYQPVVEALQRKNAGAVQQ
jgi:tetratricopeptide (TPR) repeat protein